MAAQAQPFALVDRALQRAAVQDLGQVEERTGRVGDGDAVASGDVVLSELRCQVDHDASSSPTVAGARDCYIGEGHRSWEDFPQGSGTPMAQNRTGPRAKHPRHPPSSLSEPVVAGGVHASIHPEERPSG